VAAFRELLNDCALMDVENKGCAFTWANNRDGEELVKKRLHWVLYNIEWRVRFFHAEAYALLAIGSNHSPILLSLLPPSMKRKKEFRFEAYWMEDAECQEVVQSVWKD